MSHSNDIVSALMDYESSLCQFLTSRVGCPDTANDIFQNMAERLLSKRAGLVVEDYRAYLFQAARNEVINHYRSEKARILYESESAANTGQVDIRCAERTHIANDNLQALKDALAELPPLTVQVFVLYRLKGLKQKDIAQQLGLNLSTIEKRLATALKHCRTRLNDKEIYGIAPPKTSTKKRR